MSTSAAATSRTARARHKVQGSRVSVQDVMVTLGSVTMAVLGVAVLAITAAGTLH